MNPYERDLIQKLQAAKLESTLHFLPMLPGVDSMEDVGMCYAMAIMARNRAGDDHPLRVAEVGCYAGRLSLGLACAFVSCPEDRLLLVDSFEGLRKKDPDALSVPWSQFRKAEVVSGIDYRALVAHTLSSFGHEDNIEIAHGNLENLGLTREAHERQYKLDLLIFNTIDKPYREYLEIANAWLRWLRLGSNVIFFNTQADSVSAVVRELVSRKWPIVKQGASSIRAHAVLVRPVDETSGQISTELKDADEE